MSTKLQKIGGPVLLLGGVIIVLCSLYSSYNIFRGRAKLPEIFRIAEKRAASPQEGTISDISDVQTQVQEEVGEQLKEFLRVDSIPKLLNLMTQSILAGILIFGGAQISGMGIKLTAA